jgi:hypothetical protein
LRSRSVAGLLTLVVTAGSGALEASGAPARSPKLARIKVGYLAETPDRHVIIRVLTRDNRPRARLHIYLVRQSSGRGAVKVRIVRRLVRTVPTGRRVRVPRLIVPKGLSIYLPNVG